MVVLLLQNGANIDAQNKFKLTPLAVAVQNGIVNFFQFIHLQSIKKYRKILGYEKIVDLLIENNAKLDITDKNGYTVLHIAAQKG